MHARRAWRAATCLAAAGAIGWLYAAARICARCYRLGNALDLWFRCEMAHKHDPPISTAFRAALWGYARGAKLRRWLRFETPWGAASLIEHAYASRAASALSLREYDEWKAEHAAPMWDARLWSRVQKPLPKPYFWDDAPLERNLGFLLPSLRLSMQALVSSFAHGGERGCSSGRAWRSDYGYGPDATVVHLRAGDMCARSPHTRSLAARRRATTVPRGSRAAPPLPTALASL